MPYTKLAERIEAEENYRTVTKAGQRNYLITLMILQIWNENPCYLTLWNLRKMFFTAPDRNAALKRFHRELEDTDVFWDDVKTDAQEAFHEFRDRIGTRYEALKIAENGDLPQYKDAIKIIESKLIEVQAAKSNLILPKGAI